MMIILKLLAIPVIILLFVLAWVGNLIMRFSSWVIGLLLLVITGCGIYCITQARWKDLALLVGMGVAGFLVIFAMVWIVFVVENWRDSLGAFIRS